MTKKYGIYGWKEKTTLKQEISNSKNTELWDHRQQHVVEEPVCEEEGGTLHAVEESVSEQEGSLLYVVGEPVREEEVEHFLLLRSLSVRKKETSLSTSCGKRDSLTRLQTSAFKKSNIFCWTIVSSSSLLKYSKSKLTLPCQ